MSVGDVVRVALSGLAVGVATYLLYLLLDKYVFTPTLCGATAAALKCDNKMYFASGVATVLGAFGGLFAMVQQRVYRPLLVVLLATVGLWNFVLIAATLPWWLALLLTGLIFALAYAAFAWLVQLRNFILALVITVVILVVMRLIISA